MLVRRRTDSASSLYSSSSLHIYRPDNSTCHRLHRLLLLHHHLRLHRQERLPLTAWTSWEMQKTHQHSSHFALPCLSQNSICSSLPKTLSAFCCTRLEDVACADMSIQAESYPCRVSTDLEDRSRSCPWEVWHSAIDYHTHRRQDRVSACDCALKWQYIETHSCTTTSSAQSCCLLRQQMAFCSTSV